MLTSSQKSHVPRARHTPHVIGSQSGRVAVFCGVLFLSGTGALIFETLWLRLSGLAFGNSVWAAALILSSFMAGLHWETRWLHHRESGDGGRCIYTLCWRSSLHFLGARLFLVFPSLAN